MPSKPISESPGLKQTELYFQKSSLMRQGVIPKSALPPSRGAGGNTVGKGMWESGQHRKGLETSQSVPETPRSYVLIPSSTPPPLPLPTPHPSELQVDPTSEGGSSN